jgi:Rieske Fe-S protein
MSDHTHHPAAASAAPEGRRSFLTWAAVGLGGVAALLTAVPFVGYLLGPLLKKRTEEEIKQDEVKLGPVNEFPEGQTRPKTFVNPLKQPWDGMAANTLVYVRRLKKAEGEPADFQVFAANCAHLGCPVTWFPQSGLFMCPCHGGVYYEDGRHASGPPPRGLFECVWSVRKVDGVDTLVIQAPHLPTLQDTLKDQG